MRHLCLLALAFATPASAEFFPIRDADWDRLAAQTSLLETTRANALAQGDPADVAVLTEVLSGRAGPEDLAGDWNCRTIKMGGYLPLTVYGNFRCTITQTGPREWYLEKITGSQRTRGVIRDDDGFLAYLGVGYVDGGPAVDYADLPADQIAVEPGQTVPVIGEVQQMDANRARILLPAPLLESDFDILYLTR